MRDTGHRGQQARLALPRHIIDILSALQGADEAFLQKAGIPPQQTYALKEGLPVDETAKEYEGQLLRISQSVLPRNSVGECVSAYPIPV